MRSGLILRNSEPALEESVPQSTFDLHPKLEADTKQVLDLPLCRVLLMNDSRYPWLILVPRRPDVREIHGLDATDRFQLMEEIAGCAAALERETNAFKMNVGALGNMVPQLHVHVIARFEDDPAWAGPVWGVGSAVPYDAEAYHATAARYRAAIEAMQQGRL